MQTILTLSHRGQSRLVITGRLSRAFVPNASASVAGDTGQNSDGHPQGSRNRVLPASFFETRGVLRLGSTSGGVVFGFRTDPEASRFAGGFPLAALPTTVATLTPIALQITNTVTRLGTLTPFSMNVMVRWSRPAFCAKASFDNPHLRRWNTRCSATKRANCCSSGKSRTGSKDETAAANVHQRIL